MRIRQGKPDWALTNVGWEVRKIVWLLWAMGETLPQTAMFLKLNKDDFPDDRQYHVDTLRRVRKELVAVPVEILDRLVEEVPGVRSFLINQRVDYASKQGKATVSIGRIKEGAYDNAIKLIKEFYKNQTPPSGLRVIIDNNEESEV